jgi:hypothetical protein
MVVIMMRRRERNKRPEQTVRAVCKGTEQVEKITATGDKWREGRRAPA